MRFQFAKLYNRFPYRFEYQFDGAPYEIPAHSEETVTLEMAFAAVKQSMYRVAEDGTPLFGVVPVGDPMYGVPLSLDEIKTGDPVQDMEIRFAEPEKYKAVTIDVRDVLPSKRRPIDVSCLVVTGEVN